MRIIDVLKFLMPKRIRDFAKSIVFCNYYYCPFCDGYFKKMGPMGFNHDVLSKYQIVGGGLRKNSRCPNCSSLDRERLLYVYLKKFNLFNAKGRVLHIAPERSLSELFLKEKGDDYIRGDKFNFGNGVRKIDLLKIPFSDNTFDLIICNHVLEHIIEDDIAMSELFRVMKKGGKAILQVPISIKLEGTYEDSSIISEQQREETFGQIDHVRIYAYDYLKRLQSVGFKTEVFSLKNSNKKKFVKKYALNPDENIFIAMKN